MTRSPPWQSMKWGAFERALSKFGSCRGSRPGKTPKNLGDLLASKEWRGSNVETVEEAQLRPPPMVGGERAEGPCFGSVELIAVVTHSSGAIARIRMPPL